MLKRFAACLFILALSLSAAGCQPSSADAPDTPLRIYYEALLAQDYATAYQQLCQSDQAAVSQEDFITWQTLYRQMEEMRSYKYSSGKELSGFKDPVGNRYPRAMEYTVTQTDFLHQSQSENTYDYTRTVVLENGSWRICRGENANIYQHRIYYGYATLGTMYAEGKGVEQNAEKALDFYTNALNYNETDYNLYFQAALLNLNAQRPQEAEALCTRALAKEPDSETASELQNLMGVALMMTDRKADALKAFQAAVDLNPSNSNAVSNLDKAGKAQ